MLNEIKTDSLVQEIKSREKEILTVKGVMNLLGVSKTTIYRYLQNGSLTGYRMVGKLYFKRSDIISKLEEGKVSVLILESDAA